MNIKLWFSYFEVFLLDRDWSLQTSDNGYSKTIYATHYSHKKCYHCHFDLQLLLILKNRNVIQNWSFNFQITEFISKATEAENFAAIALSLESATPQKFRIKIDEIYS